MKTNDQKQLEFLYEQINQPFKLLEDEKEYFDKVSKQLADHIVIKKDNLMKFVLTKKSNFLQHTLTNFDKLLWIEPLPWFFDKNDTTKLEHVVNNTYKDWIIENALANVHVKKIDFPEPSLMLEFMHPYNRIQVIYSVHIEDKKGIEQVLKHYLIKSLELWYEDLEYAASYNELKEWYNWRHDQVTYQPLRNKHPELEGIF